VDHAEQQVEVSRDQSLKLFHLAGFAPAHGGKLDMGDIKLAFLSRDLDHRRDALVIRIHRPLAGAGTFFGGVPHDDLGHRAIVEMGNFLKKNSGKFDAILHERLQLGFGGRSHPIRVLRLHRNYVRRRMAKSRR